MPPNCRAGISEFGVNAALAFIETAKPHDDIESALVIQMACTHSVDAARMGEASA
jgi:hypothetical protein